MAVTPRRITLAEFLALPEEKPPLELHNGVITTMSPKGPHSLVAFELGVTLVDAGRPERSLCVLVEARFSVDGESWVPDLVAYRRDRIPIDEYGNVAEDFLTPPDLVVEVMSHGQVLGTMLERCRSMVRSGVPFVVLLQPRGRIAWVFRSDWESGPLRDDDRINFSELVAGCTLTVREIFAPLHVRAPEPSLPPSEA